MCMCLWLEKDLEGAFLAVLLLLFDNWSEYVSTCAAVLRFYASTLHSN